MSAPIYCGWIPVGADGLLYQSVSRRSDAYRIGGISMILARAWPGEVDGAITGNVLR